MFVAADVDMRVLTLPDGNDPAEFLSTHGAEAFNRMVEGAPDAIEHKLNRSTVGIDLVRDTHQASAALDSLLKLIAKSPQQAGGLRLEQTVMRLSRTFSLPVESLHRRIADHRRQQQQRQRFVQPEPAVEPVRRRQESVTGIDRELFELMIERSDLAPQALEAIDPKWLATETARQIFVAYEDLELEGRDLDVQNVLLAVEDTFLKGALVDLQQAIDQKSAASNVPPEGRWKAVIDRYQQAEAARQRQRELSRLESSHLEDDEALEVLNQLFALERSRQGLLNNSSPNEHPRNQTK
ncbi:MAG: hypothetical protein R3C05_16005 [Pirellulaceae bacterium]